MRHCDSTFLDSNFLNKLWIDSCCGSSKCVLHISNHDCQCFPRSSILSELSECVAKFRFLCVRVLPLRKRWGASEKNLFGCPFLEKFLRFLSLRIFWWYCCMLPGCYLGSLLVQSGTLGDANSEAVKFWLEKTSYTVRVCPSKKTKCCS